VLSGLLRQSISVILIARFSNRFPEPLLKGHPEKETLAKLTARPGWRKIFYRAGIALGLGLLLQQAWQGIVALQQTQSCVARPVYFGLVLATFLAAYGVQMAAWALIMRSLAAPLSARTVFQGYALAFLPRYIPGSVWGYLSRNEWLAQSHQVSYAVSTTASLIEAAMLLLTAGWIGALYALPMHWPHPLLTPALIMLGGVATALVWYATPWLARRVFKGHSHLQAPAPRRHAHALLVATTLLYLLFWGLQGAALVSIGRALCDNLTVAPFATTAASALSWAIGFLIIFVPAGLGVREWTLSTMLVSFTALPSGQATLLALVSRLGLIAAEFIVLLLSLPPIIEKWRARRALAVDKRSQRQT
jgi:hypothetical protein